MTKSDLKTGMMVKFRNGNYRMVMKGVEGNDRLVGKLGHFTTLDEINEDLSHAYEKDRDIVKVRSYWKIPFGTEGIVLCEEEVEPKREDVEMTLNEICDALGKNVKIVP